jgi:hypothetical protein
MDMNLEKIARSREYFTPYQRYISGRIVEYDIKSANITMLKKYNIIDNGYYTYLSNLPKYNREVEIGLKIRESKEYYEAIQKGIIDSKLLLFQYNDIQEPEVIRIANDAVYINRSIDLKYTQFGDVLFRQKSISDVVLKIDTLIFFYFNRNNEMNIDVKGLGNNQIFHQKYMLSFIASVINLVEISSLNDAINFITDFYKEYISKALDIGFYRELNPMSMYKISGSNYCISNATNINDIDISFNASLIRELYSILLSKFR